MLLPLTRLRGYDRAVSCARHHTEDGEPVRADDPTQMVWCPDAKEWMTRWVHQQRFAPECVDVFAARRSAVEGRIAILKADVEEADRKKRIAMQEIRELEERL